jgi:hypothetical protein
MITVAKLPPILGHHIVNGTYDIYFGKVPHGDRPPVIVMVYRHKQAHSDVVYGLPTREYVEGLLQRSDVQKALGEGEVRLFDNEAEHEMIVAQLVAGDQKPAGESVQVSV